MPNMYKHIIRVMVFRFASLISRIGNLDSGPAMLTASAPNKPKNADASPFVKAANRANADEYGIPST